MLQNGVFEKWSAVCMGGVARRVQKESPVIQNSVSFLHFRLDTQHSDLACPRVVLGAVSQKSASSSGPTQSLRIGIKDSWL